MFFYVEGDKIVSSKNKPRKAKYVEVIKKTKTVTIRSPKGSKTLSPKMFSKHPYPVGRFYVVMFKELIEVFGEYHGSRLGNEIVFHLET